MKKTLKMFVAALMVMVLAIVTPLQSYAAEQKTYISDLQVIYASSYDEAKKQASEGYTVINQKMDGQEGVWLSYKPTTNKDEAITDVAAINMNGGWSTEEFDKVLAQKKDDVATFISSLTTAITGYQKRYKANEAAAVFAHDVLNRLIDDDTNMGIGDLLLQSDVSSRLQKIVLESTPLATDTILSYLGVANTGDWVQSIDWGAEITDASAADKADKIYELLPDLYQGFKDYQKSGIDLKDITEEELNEQLQNLPAETAMNILAYGSAYEILSSENAELLNLFYQNPETIDKEELLPIAAVMDDALMECIDSLGLAKAICFSGITEDGIKEIKSLDIFKSTETASVYAGVDRSIFEGSGVAMTSEAIRAQTSQGGNTQKTLTKAYTVLKYLAIGLASAAGVAAIVTGALVGIKGIHFLAGWDAIPSLLEYAKCGGGAQILKVGGTVVAVLVAVAVLCLIAAVVLKYAFIDKRDVKYTSIPRIMISKETKDGKEYMIAYKAVADTSGKKYADLNNWKGSQWNALYYTKDIDAGNPLTTDCFTGSDISKLDTSKTYTSVHPFGSTAAYNLNAYHWTTQSSLYLAFAQDTSASGNSSAAATSVSTAGYAITAVAGIAVGALATWLGERALNRKRKAAKV